MSGSDEGAAPERGPSDDGTAAEETGAGDTFGVGIHVTDAEFQFVVHVPSDIDSGWTDPEAFQRVVERAVWDRLDRAATLRAIGDRVPVGETVTLGWITLTPDGTVLESSLDASVAKS